MIMQKRSSKGRKTSGRKRSGANKKEFPQFVGKVQMTREGFIFVIIEGQDDDVFVKASKTRHALHGDTVRVAVTRQKSGDVRRREGEVVEIIERSKKPFVGYYHTVGAQAWVLMQSKSMPYDIQVDAEAGAAMGAQPGMKVAAVVDHWERREPGPFGHLTDVLGVPGENDTEMHAILAEFNLPYRFSEEVEHAADKISDEITAEDLKGRKDFRQTFTLTIDPADAKDFDDALSFKPLENGNYEVGVHIADVSYYVRPGSLVDKEARERGTSVYLVDRTVPMLPEKLCNKLCSLRPHEDKLTFSAVFEMTPKAEIKSRWIGRTVINSDFRLDYDQAQQIIESAAADSAAPADSELNTAIVVLNKLAGILKERERAAGAIDFDRPEMKVEVDEKGKPVRVYQKVSKEANWLIEEFMLLANRTVAEFVATGGQMNGVAQKNAKTFVYRVHGEPNELKLENLYTFAKGFGYRIPTDKPGGRPRHGQEPQPAAGLRQGQARIRRPGEPGAARHGQGLLQHRQHRPLRPGVQVLHALHLPDPPLPRPDGPPPAGPLPGQRRERQEGQIRRGMPLRLRARARGRGRRAHLHQIQARGVHDGQDRRRSTTATCPASPNGACTWRSSPPRSRAWCPCATSSPTSTNSTRRATGWSASAATTSSASATRSASRSRAPTWSSACWTTN